MIRCSIFVGLVLAVAGCQKKPAPQSDADKPAPAKAPDAKPLDAGTPPAQVYGRNLLVNAGAEAELVDNDPAKVRGWDPQGQVTATNYGSTAGEPNEVTPGPPDRGKRYLRCGVFGGGPKPGKAVTQQLDLMAIAGDIDAGKVKCKLAGWFGGLGDGDAYMKLIFRDATGMERGTLQTDPVKEADRKPDAALVERVKHGDVPKGTRRVDAVLQFYSPGAENSETVAFADGLSFVLSR
jgi:hypothetical protein